MEIGLPDGGGSGFPESIASVSCGRTLVNLHVSISSMLRPLDLLIRQTASTGRDYYFCLLRQRNDRKHTNALRVLPSRNTSVDAKIGRPRHWLGAAEVREKSHYLVPHLLL